VKSPKIKWIVLLVKAIVSVGLLIILIRYIQPARLQATLREAKFIYLIFAGLLMPFNLLAQVLRWRLLASTEVSNIPLSRYWFSLLGGFTFGLITPGRMGEIGRVFLLKAPSRLRLAGLHIMDKLFFVGAVALLGPLMLFLMPGFSQNLPGNLRIGIGVIVSLLPLLYFYLAFDLRPLKSLLLGVQLTFPAKPRILELLRAFEGLKSRHCLGAVGLTAIQFLIVLTQFQLTTLAFQPVKWIYAAHTYWAVLFVKTILPISLGSLGIGEWASVSFYQHYGIAEQNAFSASLLLFGMNVLLPGLLGLIAILHARTNAIVQIIASESEEAA